MLLPDSLKSREVGVYSLWLRLSFKWQQGGLGCRGNVEVHVVRMIFANSLRPTDSQWSWPFGLPDRGLGFYDRRWHGEVIIHHRTLGCQACQADNPKLLGQLPIVITTPSHPPPLLCGHPLLLPSRHLRQTPSFSASSSGNVEDKAAAAFALCHDSCSLRPPPDTLVRACGPGDCFRCLRLFYGEDRCWAGPR
jgi:hypothetical protein